MADDRVAILMAVRNGAADLPEQLESLAAQTHRAWDLVASDDGSDDDSPVILARFGERMRREGRTVTLLAGPRSGFVANFLGLIARAPDDAGWLALADQDDVWLPDRLARGIAALRALPAEVPALYCSRTWITDERLGNRRLYTLFTRPPSFRNALVQNIATGNTILLNRAAADLARAEAPRAADAALPGLAAHDWWLYQLVTGAGGAVVYDPEPTVLYRQHARNLIGANDGWRARMNRVGLLLAGRFRDWNAASIRALGASEARLTPENRALLTRFAAVRRHALGPRLAGFAGLGVYRQGAAGQTALWLAVALGRF